LYNKGELTKVRQENIELKVNAQNYASRCSSRSESKDDLDSLRTENENMQKYLEVAQSSI
jgi:hypothetical protein